MSHIRSSIDLEDGLYQSVEGVPSPIPAAASAAVPGWLRSGRAVAARLALWRSYRRARRDLALLDARSLRDLGVAPEQIIYELSRPFWRPLRDWRS
jgi:uncharacterized protein YjiS (DUF1127 family)